MRFVKFAKEENVAPSEKISFKITMSRIHQNPFLRVLLQVSLPPSGAKGWQSTPGTKSWRQTHCRWKDHFVSRRCNKGLGSWCRSLLLGAGVLPLTRLHFIQKSLKWTVTGNRSNKSGFWKGLANQLEVRNNDMGNELPAYWCHNNSAIHFDCSMQH